MAGGTPGKRSGAGKTVRVSPARAKGTTRGRERLPAPALLLVASRSGRYDAALLLDRHIGRLICPHENMGWDTVSLLRVEQVIEARLDAGAFAQERFHRHKLGDVAIALEGFSVAAPIETKGDADNAPLCGPCGCGFYR